MNPEKRGYNGWILCPSTRFLGKFYYFNPATGEAVWNLSDMEGRMASQQNFPQSERWHGYPEPDCPPEETSNPWGYQPDFQVFPQPSPPFGQAMFPKYAPNAFPPNMPWGMPPVYMPPMMPTYNPMTQAQCWANLRTHQKQFMPDKSFPNNPYNQKVPSFNPGTNRHVFGIKPKPNNFPVFSQMKNPNREVTSKPNWEIMRKRTHTITENENEKEPLFKRLRSQIDLQNDNLFAERNNLYGAQSFESGIADNFSKPSRMPSLQQINCTNHCDCCKLSKSSENLLLMSQLSKSQSNLSNIGKTREQIFKPPQLQRHRSLESLLNPASEVSSKFSIENSFIFPLNKSDSKVSSMANSVKKVQNSTVSQSGQDKVLSESSDSKLSETDLRYILMARRRNSSVTEVQETKQENCEAKKIKTNYSDTNKQYGDSFSKKRVTFDLGVEDIVAGNIEDGNTELDNVGDPEEVTEPFEEDVPKSHYVVADLEALLAEFELIDKFVQSDECILLIPAHIFRAIETTGVDISAPRNRVIAARQITRHIARQVNNNETNILVQTEDIDSMDTCDPDGDPTLNSCLKLYNDGHHVMLITNNPDLNIQAKSFDLECYTTEEIKEYISTPKPEVSFDIQKVGNTGDTSAGNCQPKVNGSNNNLFDKPDTSNQFFLNKPHEESEINNDESVQMKCQTVVNHRNPFLDKDDDLLEETQFKIKNLKLQEKTDNFKLQEKINNLKMQLKIDSQKLQERMNRRKLKETVTSENMQEKFKNQKYQDIFDIQKLKERISNHDLQMKFDSQKLKGRIESQRLQERLDDSKMKEIIDNHQMQLIKDNRNMLEGRDNLNMQARNDNQKIALAGNKKQKAEKENTTFDNEFEPKEDHFTAKNKIKSINVYNLQGLLKSFSMKSKDMEERIVARMDEYVCWFRQIMEDVLEDIVKDVPGRQCEDQTKTIIQNQLSLLREIVTDHRTASALTDKLIAVVDRAFLPAKFAPDSELCGRPMLLNTRRALRLNANDFVKMFACGTLLVKVLRSIADDASLQDGETLLEQLEHSLEKWEFEPEPNTPVTPGTGAEPRPEFKRHRGEVILYLMKNLPQWKNYIPNDNEIPPDRLQEVPKVTEKVTPKVISTCGKNVGLLKLNPKKPIQFDDNQENQIKNNENAKKDVSNNINAKIEGNEVIKSKAIREIGFDSFKPHKVKEIDVAKRENDDKELTEMLEQMMKKQPLTKSYDLKTIIIDKDEGNEDNYKSFENSSKIKTNEDLKLKTAAKRTHQNTNFTNYNTAKSTPNNVTDKNEEKKENKTVYKITDLDLDVLDYSEIEEDEEEVNEYESIDEYSSNRLVIVESDHCNDVTTTHHEQEDTPDIEQNNDINNKNDINNENISNEIDIWNSSGIGKENDDEFDNEADEENCDSGIDSCEAYSLVQLFLSKLRETFLIIKVFIEESVTELNYDMDEGSMNVLNQQVDVAQGSVNNIIHNLNNIIDRESNPDSALMPTLLKGVPEAETDKRIIKYRRVISKWLSQARVLQRSLQILQRIAQRNLQVRDLSDVSDNYSNLFE